MILKWEGLNGLDAIPSGGTKPNHPKLRQRGEKGSNRLHGPAIVIVFLGGIVDFNLFCLKVSM